jgi:predicted transcriptional regulator
MSDKDVVMIGPDQDVEEAGGCWLSTQLDRLLVIEESDRLVGIVSEADLRRGRPLGIANSRRPTQRRVIHKW